MPLPKSHLESLERHMRIHEEELADLRTSLRAVTREIGRRQETHPERVPDKERDPANKAGGVSVLESQRDVIEREIAIHDALIALGRDRRILDALGEIAGAPDLAREAARDPSAFARERGIELPANMELKLDVDRERLTLRVTYYNELAPFVLTWDRDGFSPPRLDPRRAVGSGTKRRAEAPYGTSAAS
jgi:hypothetical protein